jgi:hypothetical protein
MNKKRETQSKRLIDARTFQHQLAKLANTVALKVEREGVKVMKPQFTAADVTVLLRQSLSTYELMCFVNADDTRKRGSWKPAYSAAILPLNRSMIDCLYNITTLLQFPSQRYAFRESGYRFALEGLKADEERYRGKRSWRTYIKKHRDHLSIGMNTDGITLTEVEAAKMWPTLSSYLRVKKGTPLTPHQDFLKKLTFIFWQEYSAMTHAVFQGLMPSAVFYIPDKIPHEFREQFDTIVVERMIATHLVRNAAVLLCTLTEVQAHFRFFDEARINERILHVWNALLRVPEVKELYDARYEQLMRDKGIT